MNANSYGGAGVPNPHPSADALRELLGPVRQIGYVVADVEASARSWATRTGVGPWRVRHNIAFDHCTFRGQRIDVEVSIASSYTDGVELECIAQSSGPASMYTEHLRRAPGAQHVCFYPANYDQALHHLQTTGMHVELDGAIGGTRFAYLDDGHGQVLEIADVSAKGLNARLARAEMAAHWLGSPIIIHPSAYY